jgi:predicted DNA-binding protein
VFNQEDQIMSVITARIPETLNKALTEVAKSMERPKSFIVLKAIQNYVLELQEDIEDYNDAIEALKDDSPTISLEEVIRKSGLADQIGFRDE